MKKLLFILLLVVAGCERRPLEDRETKMAEVNVELDWSRSSLTPTEATVIFYDENGNSPRTLYVIGMRGTIKLPVGRYSVVAFNDKMGDFSQFAFRGTACYKTIEVYATEMSQSNYYGGSMEQTAEDSYDQLASDSRDAFEVTQAMFEETSTSRVQLGGASTRGRVHLVMTPTDVVAATKLTVHFKNMHLIRTGSQRAKLTGFAESVALWNRKASVAFITHTLPLSYAQYYEGSTTDGAMSEQFTSFGLCTPNARKQPVNLLIEAILRDKEQTKFSYQKDITDFIEIKSEGGLKINIEIGTDPANGNPPLPIPEIDPIDDSAFRPGVDDWEEEEIIKPL